MDGFTDLEIAALKSIFSETPEFTPDLQRQFDRAKVVKRENSGAGFFTTIVVSDDTPRVTSPAELGSETHARVDGLQHGLGFVLFMENGLLHVLEGYTYMPESTAAFDLASIGFEMFKAAVNHQA